MQRFLVGDDLNKAVDKILAERGCRCAVAFWGKGAAGKLHNGGEDARIICNLKMGGTNPYEIEKLDRPRLRQSEILHAKVYIGARQAVVTSANASANGLGLEGAEQAKWIEAGVLVDNLEAIGAWFEKLWRSASEIKDGDIEDAKRAWRSRRARKPQLASFAEFDPEQEPMPLPYFLAGEEWDYNPDALEELGGGTNAKRLIDNGMEVDKGDTLAMAEETWLVIWGRRPKDLGLPDRRYKPRWFLCGKLLKKAFEYTGRDRDSEFRDIVLDETRKGTRPFDLSEDFVRETFWEVISEDRFEELRRTTDGQGFFSKKGRIGLIREFWRECKKRYEQKKRTAAKC